VTTVQPSGAVTVGLAPPCPGLGLYYMTTVQPRRHSSLVSSSLPSHSSNLRIRESIQKHNFDLRINYLHLILIALDQALLLLLGERRCRDVAVLGRVIEVVRSKGKRKKSRVREGGVMQEMHLKLHTPRRESIDRR
jgi:hypothetical protein